MKANLLLLTSLVCLPVVMTADSNLPALAETKLAAEQGNAIAQNKLGNAYASRLDYANALVWYRQAADQGLADAQCNYADLLIRDIPVTVDGKASVQRKNPSEASKWFYKAALQGHMMAQFRLSRFYEDGLVAKQDLVEAYKWMSLSIKNGNSTAAVYRDSLILKMTSEQIAEGQKRADAFVAEKPSQAK